MVARPLLLAVAACLMAGCASRSPAPDGGVATPEITSLSGEALRFEDLLADRRQTMVAFMTAWCEACRREQPALHRWASAYRASSRALLVISGSPLLEARNLVTERRIDTAKLRVVVDAQGLLANRVDVRRTPTFLVYEPGGRLAGRYHHLDELPRPRTSFLARVDDSGAELGTSYDVEVLTSTDRMDDARRALTEARQRCQQLGRRFSEWRDDSEIAAVNTRAANQRVTISDELHQILSGAQHVARVTRGAFDITWRPLAAVWDAAAARGVSPDDEALARALAAVGYQRLALGPNTVRFEHPEMALGIAGVAKGWIIDALFHQLRRAGHQHVLVNIGGDLRTSGRDLSGAPRRLGLIDPYSTGASIVAEIEVADTAVATSGNYLRGRDVAGSRVGHILDPRTGRPPQFDGSVTVLARDAALADALATALFVMGPDAGLNLVDRTPDLEAVFVTRDGLRASRGIRLADR